MRKLPKHVAIIMDGNGRWAKQRGLQRFQGHLAGAEAVRPIVEEAAKLGIRELTLYSFSSENWKRPPKEVSYLMHLLCRYLQRELPTFREHNVQLRVIGDLRRLPERVKTALRATIRQTEGHTGMILRLALSYGGRQEILYAVQRLLQDALSGKIRPEEVNEYLFSQYLYDPEMADPDLIIRTSGELRLSNFLLWQSSYAEFWVTPTFWPDFSVEEFHKALAEYEKRERRYGAISAESR